MPVRNEADFIERSLGAVVAQDYPSLEVLVVDGMSEDATRQIVMEVATSYPGRKVTLVDNPTRIVANALNLALGMAHGEIVVRVDGHCVVGPDYVRRCVEVLEATGAACVGGPIDTVGDTLRGRAIALAQSSRFGVGGVAFRTGRKEAGPVDTVPFGAYRREIFERVGMFDVELVRNQDDEFNYRLNRAGETVWLDPSIRSQYYSRATFRKLWRQYLEYGLYKVRVLQQTGFVSIRHVVPSAFVLGMAFASAISVITRQPLWIGGLVGAYVVASLGASLTRSRNDLRTLPLLPVAYLVIHISYGLGFLAGLWRWRSFPRKRRVGAADA